MTKYIAIAGNMGCGKTTLVDFICQTFQIQPFFEPNANNPYLGDFYSDMKRWAFHSQLYFLSHKFRIHQELEAQRVKNTVIQDRTIYEDSEIFAQHLYRKRCISKRDWEVYQDLYQTILNSLAPPDLLIYLRASVKTIRKRIKIRGRAMEQNVPTLYLRNLNVLYEMWFASYRRSKTIIIDTDRLDYLSDLIHRRDLLTTIEKHL